MKEKQEKSIVIFLIALIFIFSFIVGYVFYSRRGYEYEYEGITGKFLFSVDKHTGDEIHILKFYTKTRFKPSQGYKVPFNYGPEELEIIPVEGEPRKEILDAKKVYFTRDVYLDQKTNEEIIVAIFTVDRIIGQNLLSNPIYNISTSFAAIENNTLATELQLPILACDQANKARVIIWFKEGDENKVYYENEYCIVAQFKEGDDPKKVATRLTYHILGIM